MARVWSFLPQSAQCGKGRTQLAKTAELRRGRKRGRRRNRGPNAPPHAAHTDASHRGLSVLTSHRPVRQWPCDSARPLLFARPIRHHPTVSRPAGSASQGLSCLYTRLVTTVLRHDGWAGLAATARRTWPAVQAVRQPGSVRPDRCPASGAQCTSFVRA